jgi:hypothetical protein
MKKPIDLSLDKSLFSGKIVDRALDAYRAMVEKRMSDPDTMKTPYGTWVSHDDGSYSMLSTLDNRYVDTELSYPFLPIQDKDVVFERVHDGKGVTVMESLQSRKEMRCRARKTLFQFMTNQSMDATNYNDPIVYIPVVDNASSQRVYNRTKTCITGKLVRCVNSSRESGNFLIDQDLYDEVYAQRCAQGPAVSAGNVLVPVLLDQVIAANLKHYKRTQNGVTPEERYKCFINQKTLAMLEANHVNTEHLWSRFAVQGLLTGLPLVVRTMPKQLCETNLLSPSSGGSGYDVATSIFYAMWSLGCADDFLINLDLVNPNKSKRGLHMEFNLGGKRNDLVDMTWRSPENRDGEIMLSQPDKETEVIVDDLEDILKIFEMAVKEGMGVAQ